jgi:hypothetical protein
MKNYPVLDEVPEAVRYFSGRWKQIGGGMHSDFLAATEQSRVLRAQVAGRGWYLFSDFMPRLLSLAMHRVSNNRVRAQIVDVLRDELGRQPGEIIHSEMFAAAIAQAGVTAVPGEIGHLSNLFELLAKAVQEANSDAEILGILLGLEIMANENIETLIQALAHAPSVQADLEVTDFFRVHRANEDDHIANGIDNFRRFGVLESESFEEGFDRGVYFWCRFWNELQTAVMGLSR